MTLSAVSTDVAVDDDPDRVFDASTTWVS